jgi:hypothetical protein
MKVITTREIRQEAKTYLELAEIERVSIKRGKKFVNLIVSDTPDKVFVDESWIKELLSIPEEYRCNPFEVSPSGDLFWADKRNVEQLKQSVEVANTEKRTLLHKEDQKKFLGIE